LLDVIDPQNLGTTTEPEFGEVRTTFGCRCSSSQTLRGMPMNVQHQMTAAPRGWLRFRMRSLLAFVALCAVASKFGSHVNGYYAEQHALGELRGLRAASEPPLTFLVR
jgi:hypothetical protein